MDAGPARSACRMLLVRHGQSEWNAAGRWQGQADPPLSDLGREQARRAAAALASVEAIYASDLRRAVETARIIAGELALDPVVVDPDLRERDAGEWSGLTRVEIEAQYPGWLEGPVPDAHSGFAPARDTSPRRRPAGWEPDERLQGRALRALGRIADGESGDVLVVTHGGLIYAVEQHLGAPFERLANAGGRWVVSSQEGLRLGERVLLISDDDTPVTVPRQL
jgi:broad specificity phosphatase PhoE